MRKKNKKVFVGMSGGVDSAVSAMLLRDEGYDVTGVFIKTWQPDYIECTQKEDRLDAMRVCAQLSIPFITIDLEDAYKKNVIDYMLNEYKNNRVPNPDVMCNKYIKFGAFLEFARKNDAKIATGHYTKIQDGKLLKHKDRTKDQSYFLYQIQKDDLRDIIFPLQDLNKSEVKEIARKNNLYVADKKESMGICMLGDISMKDFLIKELNPQKGEVRDENEKVIGTHDGVILYTIGERHGFEITKKSQDGNHKSYPYFVYKKDFENNILYVSQSHFTTLRGTRNQPQNQHNLNSNSEKSIILQDLNCFMDLSRINEPKTKTFQAQTRYHGPLYDVKIEVISGNPDNPPSLKLRRDAIKITPICNNLIAISGQSLVVYDGDVLLLGGVIS